MRKLAIVCLLTVATAAFSQDVLSFAKGTWKVDVAATKKIPANKKVIAKELADEVGGQMLKMQWAADFVITKDGLSIKIMMEDMPMEEKFSLVEKKKNALVFKDSRGSKVQATKKGKTLILQNIGKKGGNIATVLVKKK